MDTKEISVAIQGGLGSFHEEAAKLFFGDKRIYPVECLTFDELFKNVINKRVDYGVVAIENSVAGTLLKNYRMLLNAGVLIVGEQYLRVKQNLIVNKGVHDEDIKEIYSHPVALDQCSDFLKKYRERGVKIIDSNDTALSVKFIKDGSAMGAAAIAGARAAQLYDMTILDYSIESNKRNFTRFLVVTSKYPTYGREKISKSSLSFTLEHRVGSLSNLLSLFASMGINLTKIESIPVEGKEWEYIFFADLIFNDYSVYSEAISRASATVNNLKILGEYKNGR